MVCNCGGNSSEHQHAIDPSYKSLHNFIDFTHSTAINVRRPFELEKVLRAKFEEFPSVKIQSDVDPQLLVKIQFSGTVKIKSIALYSDGSGPSEMKAFVNSPDLDFSSVETKAPSQIWSLASSENYSPKGPLNYPTKIFKFSNVNHLTLFFPTNFGEGNTLISYIGIFGEFSQVRIGAVNTTYELKPNVADHKKDVTWNSTYQQGF